MRRYPLAIGAAVLLVGGLAIPASAALPGDDPNCPELPGKTCTQTPPAPLRLCPQGYAPAPDQPSPTGTLCVVVGQDKAGNLHAVVRVDPLLCAHLAVGTNARPEDLVRTLHCPVYAPPSPAPEPAPVAPPAAGDTPLPPAPVPPIVAANLPVTG